MSSSDSGRLFSTIDQSLPILELVKLIKHSFRECEFNEVQNILIEREKNMKIEMENLVRDRDMIKEEVRLLERTQGLAQLEKLKLEEKLKKSQRKCEELEETITSLMEEQRVSSDRVKRVEERYDKVCEENSKMENEKNKLIFELNEKINGLKSKNLKSERLVGAYQEKFKCLNARVVKMGQEIESLRGEKLASDKTVDELRRKELEAGQVVEELKRQNLEATQNLDELKLKKLESDKAAEFNKSRLESLAPRIKKLEETLTSMLNLKVEDLANLVDDMDKPAAAKVGEVKDSLGNGSVLYGGSGAAENIVIKPCGLRFTCNSTGSGHIGSSKKGGGNLDQSSGTKENATTTSPASPGSVAGHNPPQAVSNDADTDNGCKELRGSDPQASGKCSDGCSVRTAPSCFADGDVIEILDSDDETNPGGAAYTSDKCANVGGNKMTFEKFAQSRSSSQTNKRNRMDCGEDSLIYLTTKRKNGIRRSNEDNLLIHEKDNQVHESTHDRIISLDNDFSVKPIAETDPPRAILTPICPSASRRCEAKTGAACDFQTPMQKFNGLNVVDSTDSDDESCSDSHMNELIASLRSKKESKKWKFEADMLQAFQNDPELCMNAVCALYRQQVLAEKPTRASNLSKSGGFSHFDSVSGRALAEYLIDGDPELRLRKSVDEVKQQRPEAHGQCKRLATLYHEKLYEIYCRAEDPFFGQT